MRKPLYSSASLRLISLTFCASSFYRVYSSFWNRTPFSHPTRPVGRSTLDQLFYLSHAISDGFNKPKPGSRTILAIIDFSKAFDSVWHPALFLKLFRLASLVALLVGLNLPFLIGALAWFIKIKSRSFLVHRGVLRGSNLGPVLFCLFINNLPSFLPSSAALFMLTIWPFGPLPPRFLLRWRLHKGL